MGRERRRRTRRSTSSTSSGTTAGSTPPRAVGAPVPQPASQPLSQPMSRPAVAHAPVQVRSDRVLAREAATMISEIKRVALVSGVCFGMLAVLVVVDRLQ